VVVLGWAGEVGRLVWRYRREVVEERCCFLGVLKDRRAEYRVDFKYIFGCEDVGYLRQV
jgi:hypothetical protein